MAAATPTTPKAAARMWEAAGMPILVARCVLAAAAWVYLLAGHGGFWRTSTRLPGPPAGASPLPGARGWPSVVAVIPARDEAAILPQTLPSLLAQEYPGEFSVVLVDDGSGDGTAAVAGSLGRQPASGAGRARKVWAMAQGVAAAGECGHLLFTDADIAFAPGAVRELVWAAVADDRA